MRRWVRLYEDILDHEIGADDWLFRLFSWCLLRANYKTKIFQGVEVARGSFVTGRNKASEALGVSPSKWYRGMLRLVEIGSITLDVNSKWTTVTICNYERYNPAKMKSEQHLNSGRTADEQQMNSQRTQEKEYLSSLSKERKEGKETIGAEKSADSFSPELLEWCRWWNELHELGKVQTGVDAKNPSKGVVAGWKRVQRSKALRGLLDKQAIESAILESRFVRDSSWFTLPKLFGGTNKTGEVILEKLLAGGFRDTAGASRLQNDPRGNLALRERLLLECESEGHNG